MHLRTFALLGVLSAVALAREDTAEVCTGSLSCDAGYCCSSHGFCGRSPLHCSHSAGCNSDKGSCGAVLLDNRDLPRVIPYEELHEDTMKELIAKLSQEGAHVSLEEANESKTLESVLHRALNDKQQFMPESGNPAHGHDEMDPTNEGSSEDEKSSKSPSESPTTEKPPQDDTKSGTKDSSDPKNDNKGDPKTTTDPHKPDQQGQTKPNTVPPPAAAPGDKQKNPGGDNKTALPAKAKTSGALEKSVGSLLVLAAASLAWVF